MSKTLFRMTKKSGNKKVGPVTTFKTDRNSCPSSCSLKGNGCYAENAPLVWHWDKVSTTGFEVESLASQLRKLPPTMVRWFEAGDLPKDELGEVDRKGLKLLNHAVTKHHASWGYTHNKDQDVLGFVQDLKNVCINASAETTKEAASLARKGIDTVAVVETFPSKSWVEHGQRFVACPSQTIGVSCYECGNGKPLCSRKNRSYTIGFETHGARTKAANKALNILQ
jgi:hypothetical protein